jgi:hypothetical protein
VSCSTRRRWLLRNPLSVSACEVGASKASLALRATCSCYLNGVSAMSRKLLSLGLLAAAFTLVLGTTDAQAGNGRSHRNHRCCNQSNYWGYQQATNCGHQHVAYYACQPSSYVTTNTCGVPRVTCCNSQPACATSVVPANFATPAPLPSVDQTAPAPTPAN